MSKPSPGTSAMPAERILDAVEVLSWIDHDVSLPMMIDWGSLSPQEITSRIESMRCIHEAKELLLEAAGKMLKD